MSRIDYEDYEPDTMYPPGHTLAPVSYMRRRISVDNPRALENLLYCQKKRTRNNSKD